MGHEYTRVTDELSVRVEETPAPPTAVQRTEAAISEQWQGQRGRINQANAFIKRAKKSDARRRQEKRSRRANRRSR